jgi:hypothetical protein
LEDVEDPDDTPSSLGALGAGATRIALKGTKLDTQKSTEEDLEREKWKNQMADHKQQVYLILFFPISNH